MFKVIRVMAVASVLVQVWKVLSSLIDGMDMLHGSNLAPLVTNSQVMICLTGIAEQHSKMLDLQTAHCS
jgi:hypothetical protein